MSFLLGTVFPDEIKVPVPSVQILIDSYHVRERTGILRLGYALEKQLCFLFKRGRLLNIYLVTPENWEPLDYDQGMALMSSADDAFAKSVSLSSFGVLMNKLLIESRNGMETELVKSNQLPEYLGRSREKTDVTLLHLAWRNAAGLIFFEHDASLHLQFVSKDIFLDDEGSYEIFREWDDPQCLLTSFSPDPEVGAWREYLLRSAFAKVCENQLNRFEVLAGRALADSLVRLVATSASRQGLDISVTSRKLEDQEVFSSPQEAAKNYGLLLSEIFRHFSAVIGWRLHSEILREIVNKLSQQERQILRDFELLPQGYSYE